MSVINLSKYHDALNKANLIEYAGKVCKVVGLTIESCGPEVNIGEICRINALRGNKKIAAEVVGFKENRVLNATGA